ncbi:MAG: hypothetical protein ACRYGA_02365 [Janthinobacterium lividum]
MAVSNITTGEETPSQQVVAAANTEVVVKDTAGRSITLKKPGVLAQFKMIEMLGGDTAQNQTFVNMVFPLMYITAIDGDNVPRCSTRLELDALIQRLDEHGVAAAMKGVPEHFWPKESVEKDAAVKN